MRANTRRAIAFSTSLTIAGALGLAATEPAAAAPSSSMPVSDVLSNGRLWVPVFAEDFDTPAPAGDFLARYPDFSAYEGGTDTSGHGEYDPASVLSVEDGHLDFDLHSVDGVPRVSSISPGNYAAETTGRVSIRFRTSTTAGYKFVGLFWPDDGDWNEGEIDWPESLDLGSAPRPASAVPGSYDPTTQSMTFEPAQQDFASTDTTGWHIATTEWDHGIVRFFWDGALVASTTTAVPTTPMHLQLQAETAVDQPAPAEDATGHVDVDWITVWR
jgi:hypothetical protein